jgi:hypothetical protein
MRLLEILRADFLPWDVRGDSQHRHPAPVRVIQAVDQVQVARPAAGRAHRQLAGHSRLASCGEGRALLVPHVQPGDTSVAAQCVGEPIQRVTWNPVNPPDA